MLNEGRRYRDLVTGTWLSADPIGYADGPNRYCYVHCNPITHFDAFGLYFDSTTKSANGQKVTTMTYTASVIINGKEERRGQPMNLRIK